MQKQARKIAYEVMNLHTDCASPMASSLCCDDRCVNDNAQHCVQICSGQEQQILLGERMATYIHITRNRDFSHATH